MTTGSDPALHVDDQPNQDNPQDTPVQIVDPDELELNEAKAALAQAEDAGDQQPPQPDKEQQQPQGQQQQDNPQGQQQQPEVTMVPKARLNEVLEAQRKAEQDAAYWRGIAEARAQQVPSPGQPQQQPAPQQLTPEQRIADIRQRKTDLAKKFDTGEITMEEFKREEDKLVDEELAVRDAALLQKVQPATPQRTRQGGDELYLEALTAKLETDHPWVMVFDQVGTEADWDYLKQRALDNLAQKGIDPRNGALGRYELRREIAELADQLGPFLVGERAKAKGVALPNSGQSQPQQQQRKTADARFAKLQMQENAPPNLAAITGSSDDPAMPTDSRIEQMSDEEIAALPLATRRKLLGITA